MYENLGGKLKGLAIVEMILGVIASVVYGIITGVSLGASGWIVGIIIAVVGILVSYFFTLGLYAIGEIVENVEAVWSDISKIRSSLDKIDSSINNMNSSSNSGVVKDVKPAEAKEGEAIPLNDDLVKCPVCGSIQRNNRETCWKCEAKFN